MLRTARGGFVVAIAAALAMTAGPVAANRCASTRPSNIVGGFKAQCPSVDDPALPGCEPGTTRVVYRLDQPFPPDGTVSSTEVVSTPDSRCAGAGLSVGFAPDSYIIGCWYPQDDRGCRRLQFFDNGSWCLHMEPELLGCGGEQCENLSIETVAISNAGGSDRMLCQPRDPTQSCLSTRLNGRDQFRFILGGQCATMNIDDLGGTDDACMSSWGGTRWGAGLPGDPDFGEYDWATGAFKLIAFKSRPQCDALRRCIGNGKRALWTTTVVAVPDDRIPDNAPPCLNGSTGDCQAPMCF
jgi:hypothetical protein